MMPDWAEVWRRAYRAEEAERKEWESCLDGQPYGDSLPLYRCAYHTRRRDYAFDRLMIALDREG